MSLCDLFGITLILGGALVVVVWVSFLVVISNDTGGDE